MPRKLTVAELQNLTKAEIIQLNAELFPQYFAAIVQYGRDSNHARHWRNRIVEVNRKLVHGEAKLMAEKTPEDILDLEQLGCEGLIRAVERFDGSRGVKFSSYAIPFIKGEMSHHVRKHWPSPRPRVNRTDHDNYMLVVAAHKKALKTLPNANIDLIALNIEDKKGRRIFDADSWRELSEMMQGNAVGELNEQTIGAAPEHLAECLSALKCLPPKTHSVLVEVVIKQSANIPLVDRVSVAASRLGMTIAEVENRVMIGLEKVRTEYDRILESAI